MESANRPDALHSFANMDQLEQQVALGIEGDPKWKNDLIRLSKAKYFHQ
jgi:hypothetical protein